MYHTINEFLQDWNFEREATLKLLKCLTDESLNQKFHNKVRTPGRLAWHITIMLGEMIYKTGLSFIAINKNAPVPSSVEEIIKTYEDFSLKMTDAIKSQWTDESLKEKVSMYGETWAKEKVLTSLIKHQIHHRGQLTILMRQAGLKVPGVYGPSSEEWMAIGMAPAE